MTTQPQPLDTTAIQARADAATPGPWGWYDGSDYADVVADYQSTGPGSYTCRQQIARIEADSFFDDPAHEDADEDDASEQAMADADFIAHARADVPALLALVAELEAELDGRDQEARERWIQRQEDQLGIKYADFRAGRWEMDLAMGREMAAAYVAMAKTLLGDAPNYTETKLEFDVKVAESPEMYTLAVQRHAPGALTPHEARQRAEARVAELEQQLAAATEQVPQHLRLAIAEDLMELHNDPATPERYRAGLRYASRRIPRAQDGGY